MGSGRRPEPFAATGGRHDEVYDRDGERVGKAAGHVLLGDLAEEELAAEWAGRQGISAATRGRGIPDARRDHDRHLAEG